jgi:hypothetical protein
MNKTVLAIIAVLVLAGLGFGVYSLTRNNSQNNNDNQNEQSENSGSLSDFFAQGSDYNCTYSTSNDNENVSEAKVYISDGGEQYYAEVDYQQNDKDLTSYMIKDGDVAYTWVSGSDSGYKYSLDADSETSYTPDSDEFGNQNASLESAFGYEYDCDPWTVDNSKFTPPSDIEFTDVDALIEETQNDACDMCDSLSGESKTQCLASLNCN